MISHVKLTNCDFAVNLLKCDVLTHTEIEPGTVERTCDPAI